MKEAPPQSTENRRRHFGKRRWWLLALFLAACAYPTWREYDYQQAISEATAVGFQWSCRDPITSFRQNWRSIFLKETWTTRERALFLGSVPDLGRYRELIHRLRPTWLDGSLCRNLDALKDLKSLRGLSVHDPINLQSLEGLSDLTNLEQIQITSCGIVPLKNLDDLKNLTELRTFMLLSCHHLQNIDGLKRLTKLTKITLHPTSQIPAASLRELRAALQNTQFDF